MSTRYQYINKVANTEFRMPYSQQYLFNAISDTNHNANPNHNSKDNLNPTNPTNPTDTTNPNTRYRCE